jgi:hypothetical protein
MEEEAHPWEAPTAETWRRLRLHFTHQLCQGEITAGREGRAWPGGERQLGAELSVEGRELVCWFFYSVILVSRS